MFKIKSDPTFDASFTIVGQGKEQKLNVVLRHRTSSQYVELLQSVDEGTAKPEEVLLGLIESWEADAPLSADSLAQLEEHQPGATWALLTGYGKALMVARKGN